ncbi:hypothetical protein DVT68_13310 [Dyella solisilvae]|uniref:Uncharacterized protein n=1 Tax=Dyella solisilvae TaxID=1920168 RepID=A0A370K5Y2_9GAMM|nr:hypothetical protein DVT68_13310 [Dyella solisilvae]
MDAQLVIEWERLTMDGLPTNNYLARLVEPHVSDRFATVLQQGDRWVVIWYPNISSRQGCTFECGSLAAAQGKVELWAAHHGMSLRPHGHPGRCSFSTYEWRRL